MPDFPQHFRCLALLIAVTCFILPSRLIAQDASDRVANRQVTVDLTHKRAIGGVSKLNRTQYFNTHNPPRWSGQTPQMQQKLELEWRTFPTRFMWHPNEEVTIKEDPKRPGYVDPSFYETPLPFGVDIKSYSAEFPGVPMAFAMGHYPDFMSVQGRGHRGTPKDYEAAAEFMVEVFKNIKKHGGEVPRYLEAKNESDIPFNWCWHWDKDAWDKNCDYHETVARAFKRELPEVMVGGPTQCCDQWHLGNFANWKREMKTFIDQSGDEMDFISFHIYDYMVVSTHRDREKRLESIVRTGPRLGASLDLVENYCELQLGERKPVVVSEFGGLGQEKHFGFLHRVSDENAVASPSAEAHGQTEPFGGPYEVAEWMNLRAINGLLMGLMDRPDLVVKAIPFLLPHADWDPEYPYSMWQKEGDEFVESAQTSFYKIWKDVDGDRVLCQSPSDNLQVQAFLNGDRLFMALNNIGPTVRSFDLQLKSPDAKPTNSTISRMFFGGGKTRYFEDEKLSSFNNIVLGVDEFAMVTIEFDEPPTSAKTVDEKVFYADQVIVPINGKPQKFTVELPKDNGQVAYAKLRVSVTRDGGFGANPQVKVNGHAVNLDVDWTSGIRDYFGVAVVDVPVKSLTETNEVSVQFSGAGGHVSTVAIVRGELR